MFARPLSMTRTMRLTSSVVLPVPAAASTTRVESRSSAIKSRSTRSASTGFSIDFSFFLLRFSVTGGLSIRADPRCPYVASPSLGVPDQGRIPVKVAPRTDSLVWRRRKHSQLHSPVDDLENLNTHLTRAFVDQDGMFREASSCGAVRETRALDVETLSLPQQQGCK